MEIISNPIVLGAILVVLGLIIATIVSSFLRTVDAGTIMIVSGFRGKVDIYKEPCRALVWPLVTRATCSRRWRARKTTGWRSLLRALALASFRIWASFSIL